MFLRKSHTDRHAEGCFKTVGRRNATSIENV